MDKNIVKPVTLLVVNIFENTLTQKANVVEEAKIAANVTELWKILINIIYATLV